jgi:HK97 family phage major capsid protein
MTTGSVVRATPRGLLMGRVAKATMIGTRNGGGVDSVSAYAAGQNWHGTPELESVVKAAVTPINGSALIGTALSPDALELVRPLSLIDRISGFRPVPFYVSILRVTGEAAGGFVAPGQPKPIRAPSLERVTLEPYKVVTTLVQTHELVVATDRAGELAIANELARGLAQAANAAFIDPHAGPIAETSPGSITYGATTISSSGSSLAQVEKRSCCDD